MALLKRRKHRVKPKPLTKFERFINTTYNRLQPATDKFAINAIYQSRQDMKPIDLDPERILAKFDGTVTTLQMNAPKQVSFRVQLSWEDRDAPPKHGHLFPRLTVVQTSPYLWKSVTLAYLQLCKQAGRLL